MLIIHHIAIRAGLVFAGLVLAIPGQGASALPKAQSQSYRLCMDHYALEWRQWAHEKDKKRAVARQARMAAAREHAEAWDELATSPGIPADLALLYRKRAAEWRGQAGDKAALEPQGSIGDQELSQFCREMVAVLSLPEQASPARGHQVAVAPPANKARAAKPRQRIKRPRSPHRSTARSRISLGLGFGIGF